MHTRKKFLVYPPNYIPGESRHYKECVSVRQAKKLAIKWGKGAIIYSNILRYEKKRTLWAVSEGLFYVCEVI